MIVISVAAQGVSVGKVSSTKYYIFFKVTTRLTKIRYADGSGRVKAGAECMDRNFLIAETLESTPCATIKSMIDNS